MPYSKKQKTLACMVLAMHDGKITKEKFPRAAAVMKTMSRETADEMCHAEIKK